MLDTHIQTHKTTRLLQRAYLAELRAKVRRLAVASLSTPGPQILLLVPSLLGGRGRPLALPAAQGGSCLAAFMHGFLMLHEVGDRVLYFKRAVRIVQFFACGLLWTIQELFPTAILPGKF